MRLVGTIEAVITSDLSGCVVVSGMPAAGKTTITELAARLLPRAVQIKADGLNAMILSGRVWRLGEPADEASRQADLCDRNLCSLANNFIDSGFTVLMDQLVVDRAELDFLLSLLAPRPVMLVTLAPTVEVCQHRNTIRHPDERFDFDGYDQLEAALWRDFHNVGWWFETSTLTPDETAFQLVQEAAHRALLNPPQSKA